MEIQTSQQPPLPSITLIHSPPKPKIVIKTKSKTLSDAVRLSHDTALRMSGQAAVCIEVWDGYITTEGDRKDAILINLWIEARGPFFFVQRYKRDPFELLGSAVDGTDYSAIER